jgi:hypothetical protein
MAFAKKYMLAYVVVAAKEGGDKMEFAHGPPSAASARARGFTTVQPRTET